MARKKDFGNINTDKVYSSIEQATSRKGQQGTASPKEIEGRKESMRTSGRKGCKATRINMAFKPSNHEFIKVMSKATGRTMTEFTNLIIEAYRNEHPELMEKAREFLDEVNSGAFSRLFEAQGAQDSSLIAEGKNDIEEPEQE